MTLNLETGIVDKLAMDELKTHVAAVNKAFYDKIYADPWLKQVFRTVPQEIIERQQTDFMVGALGGPKNYGGRSPADAHPHIYVDEDMWSLRERYLREAFRVAGFPPALAERWLRVDEAFKAKIIKRSPAECKRRYATDEIICVPKPA